MNCGLNKKEIQYIKDMFLPGTKIKLLKMEDIQAVPPNTIGVVQFVDDIGTIHMNWQTGSSLGLIVGKDEFEIIN